MKKLCTMVLLLCLCQLGCWAGADVALADATPVRDMAVVTPADDADDVDDVDGADNSLVKPVDDEPADATDGTDNTNNAGNSADDSIADEKNGAENNAGDEEKNADGEVGDKPTAPELPQTLKVQFVDSATGKAAWQNVTPVNLSLAGEYLPSDVPGMATNGRTLVPVRVISEGLTATVDWQKADNTVTITLGADKIVLTIGENTALVNGREVPVPDNVSVALVDYQGVTRTMVPVRFVSENLKATVNYDGVNRIVDIIPPVGSDVDNDEEPVQLPPPGIAADGTLYRRVVIDAGHGGEDPGTNGGGWEEKVITLSVAEKVRDLLEAADFEVVMSREDDTFIPLTDRAALTRQYDAPVFVSIHCNAAENIPTANGIETYAAPDDSDDAELAGCLQKQMIAATAAKDRGVKTSRLVVLTHNEAPAALVEIGFMTNTDECAKITDGTYQDTLAKAIADGISEYFAGK